MAPGQNHVFFVQYNQLNTAIMKSLNRNTDLLCLDCVF